jgi:membrane protein implicated in regulation of membrane protease activity
MTDGQQRRGPGRYQRLAQEDAARRGLSPDEYGVYKGSEGSLVKPVNSASGLLVLSIILTVIAAGVLVFIAIIVAQSAGLIPVAPGDSEVTPVMWFFIAIFFVFPFWSWAYYRKERRAQKLRTARGLPRNLG